MDFVNCCVSVAKISDNFVDMELRIDFTNPAPNVPIAEQPFSSLSQPVLTTPFHQLNSIHEEARCPPYHCRSQISLSTKLPAVLSQLERLMELSASIVKEIRDSVALKFVLKPSNVLTTCGALPKWQSVAGKTW